MTVDEVIKMLEKYPRDMFVVVSSDAEGNSIRDLGQVSMTYLQKDGYGYEEIADEDVGGEDGFFEEDLVKAIGMWPV